MKTPARILGHPIHPMIIPFPFALWTFSLIADLIYFFGGYNYIWENIAFYTLAGGLVGGVLAAIPGIVDYFSIKDRKVSNIAAWHARFNVVALLAFAASFYLRTASGSRLVHGRLMIPVLLSVFGFLLIGVSGWLGGELVFKHRVGVESSNESADEARYPRRVA